MLAIFTAAQESDGLTFAEMLRDIPHDLPAVVVYLLLAGFIFLIWRANRRRPQA